MRLLSRAIAISIALGCVLMLHAAVHAEFKVTVSNTHLCCGACVTAVNKALADIPGVKHEASQGDSKIVLTVDNDQAAQKAIDALAAAGFYGKVNSQTVKYKPVETPQGKVQRLEVSGIHNCCGSCNRSIKAAIKSVTGITADTAKAKANTFVVEGDFSAKDLVDAASEFRVLFRSQEIVATAENFAITNVVKALGQIILVNVRMSILGKARLRSRLVTLGCLLLLIAGSHVGLGSEPTAKETGGKELNGFLRKYCFSCHDNATAAAKLSLESLSTKTEDFHRWIPVYDKLRLNEMPPKDEPQPSPEERRQAAEVLRKRLHETSFAQQQTDGRVVVRRLNITEYETTLRDLLGKQIAVKNLLPPDNAVGGFDNVSEVLDVSSVHLLRYQDAAERALRSVVPRQLPVKFRARITGREVVGKSKNAVMGGSLRLDGDTLFIYSIPYGHIPMGTATVPQMGRYLVRASLYAVGTNSKPLPVRFSAGKPWGRVTNSVLAVRDVPADKATVIEQECELNMGDLVDVLGWSLPTERQFTDRQKLNQGKAVEQDTKPGLAVEWLEIEGPLDTFPPAGYTNLFGDLPIKPNTSRILSCAEPSDPRAEAERLMRSFLTLVFRRPVDAELHDYYTQIVFAALDKKQSFENAMLLGYRTALCSPHFLLLSEPLGTRKDQSATLDDYAVAARLSYFLWSTMPDHELIQLASRGELTKPAVLQAQVERLLKDPRSDRFTENFVGQWLELRKINDTTPDPQAYAEFDDFLYWSMPKETTLFFEEILQHDRSLADFAHSDWTFLNERLARHYGIPDIYGGELRLIKLPSDCHRGGVITQASVMKVTADGTKTSPVLRGKWVLDRILGFPPSPPPPNVSAIEPDIRGATTIRQQLDKHRNIESCAACHKHIDPPGFALESFDVIGGWRDFYRGRRGTQVKLANYPNRTVIRGLDVDKGGITSDGRSFRDIDEYKQIVLADKDQLARNLAEKLLIYATGAEIQFADREVIEQLVTKSRAKNYGFRSLLHDVVQSRIFLNK